MHDAAPVGVVESGGDLAGDPDGLVDLECALTDQPLPQRLALDVGHGVPEVATRAPAPASPESKTGRICGWRSCAVIRIS